MPRPRPRRMILEYRVVILGNQRANAPFVAGAVDVAVTPEQGRKVGLHGRAGRWIAAESGSAAAIKRGGLASAVKAVIKIGPMRRIRLHNRVCREVAMKLFVDESRI